MWVRASKKNKNKKQNGKLFRDERRFGAKEKSENKHRKWKTERKIPTREFLLSWTQTNIVTIKSLLFCWSKIKFWSHFNHALCSIHGSIERGYKSHCHYFQRKQHLSSLSEHLRSRIFLAHVPETCAFQWNLLCSKMHFIELKIAENLFARSHERFIDWSARFIIAKKLRY